MKKANIKENKNNPVSILLSGAAVTTLYFNSKIQDPFNSPKMWILLFIAAYGIGFLLSGVSWNFREKYLKYFFVAVVFFLVSNLVSALFTDDTYTAFFGVNQRRTGFLTYLALAIVTLCFVVYFRLSDIKRLHITGFVVLLTLVVYGQMQINGRDFIAWNNTYNAIITTVGNPNFAAAIIAVLSTLSMGIVLSNSYSALFRILTLILILVAFWTIYLSNARQGLMAGVLGISILFLIRVFQKSRTFGYFSSITIFIVGIFSILGMLQVGPLSSFLYKGSVSVRGYYWNAGIEMFKSNWLLGIGLDRYGEYFKEFREVGYPLKYGYEITSTNAHNVPIQLFATGGIFVGISYLVLILFTFYIAFKKIFQSNGDQQILIGSIFSAWIAFQAQSIVSIDNIGISIWGWVLMGSIIGVNSQKPNMSISNKSKNLQKFTYKQQLVSTLSTVLILLLVVPLYRSESNMFKSRAAYNPQNSEMAPILKDYSDKVYNSRFSDPFYKLVTSTYLIDSGFIEIGMKRLEELNVRDPRNLDVLTYLAVANENLGRIDLAIKFRNEIKKLDPYNARNLLQLGKLHKKNGDLTSVEKILKEIEAFASTDSIYQDAIKDLRQ